MITKDIIKASVKNGTLTLKAKTEKCSYSQVYDLFNNWKANHVSSIEQAESRFMEFYNRFE